MPLLHGSLQLLFISNVIIYIQHDCFLSKGWLSPFAMHIVVVTMVMLCVFNSHYTCVLEITCLVHMTAFIYKMPPREWSSLILPVQLINLYPICVQNYCISKYAPNDNDNDNDNILFDH